jgi:hypothetical protein
MGIRVRDVSGRVMARAMSVAHVDEHGARQHDAGQRTDAKFTQSPDIRLTMVRFVVAMRLSCHSSWTASHTFRRRDAQQRQAITQDLLYPQDKR